MENPGTPQPENGDGGNKSKKIVIGIIILLILGAAGYFLSQSGFFKGALVRVKFKVSDYIKARTDCGEFCAWPIETNRESSFDVLRPVNFIAKPEDGTVRVLEADFKLSGDSADDGVYIVEDDSTAIGTEISEICVNIASSSFPSCVAPDTTINIEKRTITDESTGTTISGYNYFYNVKYSDRVIPSYVHKIDAIFTYTIKDKDGRTDSISRQLFAASPTPAEGPVSRPTATAPARPEVRPTPAEGTVGRPTAPARPVRPAPGGEAPAGRGSSAPEGPVNPTPAEDPATEPSRPIRTIPEDPPVVRPADNTTTPQSGLAARPEAEIIPPFSTEITSTTTDTATPQPTVVRPVRPAGPVNNATATTADPATPAPPVKPEAETISPSTNYLKADFTCEYKYLYTPIVTGQETSDSITIPGIGRLTADDEFDLPSLPDSLLIKFNDLTKPAYNTGDKWYYLEIDLLEKDGPRKYYKEKVDASPLRIYNRDLDDGIVLGTLIGNQNNKITYSAINANGGKGVKSKNFSTCTKNDALNESNALERDDMTRIQIPKATDFKSLFRDFFYGTSSLKNDVLEAGGIPSRPMPGGVALPPRTIPGGITEENDKKQTIEENLGYRQVELSLVDSYDPITADSGATAYFQAGCRAVKGALHVFGGSPKNVLRTPKYSPMTAYPLDVWFDISGTDNCGSETPPELSIQYCELEDKEIKVGETATFEYQIDGVSPDATVEINFGDASDPNNPPQLKISAKKSAPAAQKIEHTYTEAGEYTVQIKVGDKLCDQKIIVTAAEAPQTPADQPSSGGGSPSGGGGGGGGSPRETINPSTPKLLFCLKKVEPEDYKDVPKDYDARKVIDTLSGTAYNGKFEEQRGETIFHGYPADDKSSVFRPQQDMIRSEFFKIAYYATCIADTLIKEDRLDTNSAGFEDVPSDYWARTIIDVLANVEILDKVRTIQGLRLAFNEPLRSITRAEAMKIFVEIYLTAQNEKLPAFSPAKNTFSDVNAGDWFAPYVQYGQKLGISQGFKNLDFAGTNFFDPNSFIKREEAAIWLYQFFITMEGKTIEEKRGVER